MQAVHSLTICWSCKKKTNCPLQANQSICEAKAVADLPVLYYPVAAMRDIEHTSMGQFILNKKPYICTEVTLSINSFANHGRDVAPGAVFDLRDHKS